MVQRSIIVAAVALASLAMPPSTARCVAFVTPVDGPITAGFAPSGSYTGHWGIDFRTEHGTPVHAAEAGTVTWAGTVVNNLSITVHHGGGLRTSYSYLTEVLATAGDSVGRGEVIGLAGVDHLHFSVRIGARYVDPMLFLRCLGSDVASALRLVPVSYPAASATRHSRRDVRPTPHRPPAGRGDRISPTWPRRGSFHPGWFTMAEVRQSGL